MDNLVLIRVAAALDRRLGRAVLRDVREEGGQRFRLIFDGEHGPRSLAICLRPDGPWAGRPLAGRTAAARPPGPFAVACRRALRGAVLRGVGTPREERLLRLDFTDGHALVAELVRHRANLALLAPGGVVVAAARRPPTSRDRLRAGEPYRPPPRPSRLFDPFGVPAEAIDDYLQQDPAEAPLAERLRRNLFGLGAEGARLAVEEARAAGISVGRVLAARLAALERGELDPLVEAPEAPWEAARAGRLEQDLLRLLPWPSGEPAAGLRRFTGEDASATAGLYHESLERLAWLARRTQGLRELLEREIRRLRRAEIAVERDLGGFRDAERHRRHGEALLAGMRAARRVGDGILVPDPYDPRGGEIVVPARPGLSVAACAEELFQRHRRAERGRQRARERQRRLADRRRRLERLAAAHAGPQDTDAIESWEEEMRAERMPVALQPVSRRRPAHAGPARPRLEGVRLFETRDGCTVLVGRTARDNHRLTFRLASPEDFWLHALGCRGAHVILRNDTRRARPPRAALEEAAAVAAWFSEARQQPAAEVQWTRRRYVRKPRGAPPGTVTLKRFETIRVRPAPPADDEAGVE